MTQTIAHQDPWAFKQSRYRKTHQPGQKARILVVDDDPNVLGMLKDTLETQPSAAEQYVVDTAANGLEALDVIRSDQPPDLVIADLKMPRMTGLELLRAMRALGFEMPVVILTGAADVTAAAETIAAGAAAFVPKPASVLYLYHLVTTLLKIPGDGPALS